MTRQNIVGFEIGSLKECYTFSHINYLTVQQVKTRNSSYAVRMQIPGTDNQGSLFYVGGHHAMGYPNQLSLSQLYVTFDYLIDTMPVGGQLGICAPHAAGDTTIAYLYVDNNGHLIFKDNLGTELYNANQLSQGVWYNIGIYLEKTTNGAWELMLDGNSLATGTGNFKGNPIGGVYFGSEIWGGLVNINVDSYYDNIILDDAAFAPKARVVLLPAIAGAPIKAEWTLGTSADYTAVDDVPSDGLTSYIETDTATKEHNVVHDTCANQGIGASDTLGTVKTWLTYMKGGAGGSANGLIALGSDGVNHLNGTSYIPGDVSFYDFFKLWNVDPADSGAWTRAKIDQAESGIRAYSVGAPGTARASNLGLMLDYTPPDIVDVTVEPDLLSLTLSQAAPTIETNSGATMIPAMQGMALSSFSPTVVTQTIPASTLYVTYKSHTKVSCMCEGGDILICVDPDRVLNCAPFIEGHLERAVCGSDTCGRPLYSYYISYDPTQLVGLTQLYAMDISAIYCKDCLTAFIEWKAPFEKTCYGKDFQFILPDTTPTVGDVLVVTAVDDNVITLGWAGNGS